MRIGILGCGYVGQAAALHWKNEEHQVSVTTRKKERLSQLAECADEVVLLNEISFPLFIQQQEVLLICVAPDQNSNYATTYFETAQKVVKEIPNSSHLRHILYTSSTSVYGDHQGAWVNEETPIHCHDQNKQVLYETEQFLLSCASKELTVTVFRLGEIYGPGREIEERLKRMGHSPFAGNGESYTNLIHLDDIVRALSFAVSHKLNGIYNLCSDFHIPRKQFYEQLCQEHNLPPIQWDPTRHSLHGGNRRVSNQKIKDAGFIQNEAYPTFF